MWHRCRIEFRDRVRMKWRANLSSLGMNAKGCLQEMVDALGHVNVQPRVGQSEHYLLNEVLGIPR